MNINANLISTIVIALGMGIIGALFNGERINRKHDRKLIEAIEQKQKDAEFKIDSIYAHSVNRERALLQRIDSMYILLDQIYDQKVVTDRQYNQYKANISKQRKDIKKQWEQVGRPFVYKQN